MSIALGNVDAATITGMSGGFRRDFSLASLTDSLEISLRFNLTQLPNYESDEFSQVIVSFDGVALAGAGPDFVAQVVGNGNGGAPVTTGWTTYSITLGTVSPGPHTLVVGGYNNKKTLDDESTEILIDDVRVAGDPVSACLLDVECDDANPCTDDRCLAGTCANTPNAATCDDGVACTGGDVCAAGSCAGSDLCLGDASCQIASGTCEEPAAQDLVDALVLQNFKDHIQALSSTSAPINGSRHWSQPGNAAALDYLETELASYGYSVERHAYTHSCQTRENVYATKVGTTRPDEMIIVSGHMDSVNSQSSGSVFAPGANDDASGTSLVLEAARVFADSAIMTDRSIRFILWNNEETGLNGSSAYVSTRRALQGIENPAGSGLYPEPTWIGVIQHDMMMWDHGLPSGPNQIPGADNDIEYQANSTFAADSLALANLVNQANVDYAPAYPGEVTNDMCCTDSVPFQNEVAAISVRKNRRRAEIGNGTDPNWHRNSDVFETYSEADFALGFNALQATVGAVAEIVGARQPTNCGDGVLDPAEQCDDGNLAAGDCCSAFCSIEPVGTECRMSAGACDPAEVCDGLSDMCPIDARLGAGSVCRSAVAECDVDEVCDGLVVDCPTDSKRMDLCRGAVEVCDVAEYCDGTGDFCPIDLVASADTECRAAAGSCDIAEHCDGIVVMCPIDAVLDGVGCDDGSVCSSQDACVAGSCVGSGPLGCDDEDVCTADSCDALTGCAHDPIEGCIFPVPDVPTRSAPLGWLLALIVILGAGIALLGERAGRTPAR